MVGTLNVLMAARTAGVRRVVYSGSSSVYGEQQAGSRAVGEQSGAQPRLALRETMTPNPLSPYALQKLMAEEYVRMFHRLYGLGALSLRYFSVYGPRMDLEGAYATVIGAFLRARREGRPLQIRGDGEQRRDFTHVRDVVRANLAAMDCALEDGSAINVGRGDALSVNRIAELIGGPRVNVAPRPGEPRDTLADLRAQPCDSRLESGDRNRGRRARSDAASRAAAARLRFKETSRRRTIVASRMGPSPTPSPTYDVGEGSATKQR